MFGYEHARKQRASTWHFKKISFASGDMANFSNFKQNFSFQISKMKMFDFFILNFKIDFFKKIPFPSGRMANFFSKFENTNFQFKFQKCFFSKLSISNYPCGIKDFFLSLRLPNLFKNCKNYIFTLTKNSHIHVVNSKRDRPQLS
jgi:hypothetical protein